LRKGRDLHARRPNVDLPATDEPFAAIILCTADREKVDKRTRSKWSRVLRYAAEYKSISEPLGDRRGRDSEKNLPPCAGKSGFHLPIEVVVTPSPVMQKAADKCGVFAA
jgi:hypothetical protein